MLTRLFGTKEVHLPERSLQDRKSLTNILFVDDDEFRVVDILRTHGWENTETISDIDNLDEPRVRNAHIIFVDIRGVGISLGFEDEGLGLVAALKRKYPEKRVVVYSAESDGDRFNENLVKADERLRKNADPIQFLTLVETYSDEMFSATQCIERIRSVLRQEAGIDLTYENTQTAVKKIAKKSHFTEKDVAKVFNINRAGSVASIIGLFLSS